jgi:hypothetical protein
LEGVWLGVVYFRPAPQLKPNRFQPSNFDPREPSANQLPAALAPARDVLEDLLGSDLLCVLEDFDESWDWKGWWVKNAIEWAIPQCGTHSDRIRLATEVLRALGELDAAIADMITERRAMRRQIG